MAWVMAVGAAAIVGIFEGAHRPHEPRHAGIWIAAVAGVAGLAWGLRAIVLPFAGCLTFGVADYVIQGPPPVSSGDSRSIVVYLLLAAIVGAIFALPVVAGAALRWKWRKVRGDGRAART
jgi:hypothetical protein